MKPYMYLCVLFLVACNTNQPTPATTAITQKNDAENQAAKPASDKAKTKAVLPTKTVDTTSLAYLNSLLLDNTEENNTLSNFWKKRLIAIDSSWFTANINAYLNTKAIYKLNDSIQVLLLDFSTNVSTDEYVLTFKHDTTFVERLNIANMADGANEYNVYTYTEGSITNDSVITIEEHNITNPDTENQKDSILVTKYLIKSTGSIVKQE